MERDAAAAGIAGHGDTTDADEREVAEDVLVRDVT